MNAAHARRYVSNYQRREKWYYYIIIDTSPGEDLEHLYKHILVKSKKIIDINESGDLIKQQTARFVGSESRVFLPPNPNNYTVDDILTDYEVDITYCKLGLITKYDFDSSHRHVTEIIKARNLIGIMKSKANKQL